MYFIKSNSSPVGYESNAYMGGKKNSGLAVAAPGAFQLVMILIPGDWSVGNYVSVSSYLEIGCNTRFKGP